MQMKWKGNHRIQVPSTASIQVLLIRFDNSRGLECYLELSTTAESKPKMVKETCKVAF